MAHYILNVTFNPAPPAKAAPPLSGTTFQTMNRFKLKKDQIQKIGLSFVGFVFLLFVYFSFFLGPLNRSRNTTLIAMKDRQTKLEASKTDLSKAATLEQQAKSATTRFAALKRLNPEGAPIAWFPPRIKVFFANQHIDKAVARLETSGGPKKASSQVGRNTRG